MAYIYDPVTGEYVDGAERITQAELAAFMADFRRARQLDAAALAESVANGDLSEAKWLDAMQKLLKDQAIIEYAAGKGGIKQLTKRDYGIIGRFLKDQYKFLRGFRADLKTLSPSQIAARAKQYMRSMRAIFERGKSEARGIPKLPFYPGSGATPCLGACLCFLEYVRDGKDWLVYWRLGGNENHCDRCPQLAGEWNPYTP